MIPLITAALGIISVLLEMWVQNSPQRKKEKADEAIQSGRQDLLDGNVPAIEQRIDRLLTDAGSSPARLADPTDAERRIRDL